ncbi:Cgl0159 family (beta/alpha)8-fold protein [Propionimicrobium lymphophilum]|uniref:Cgl0159 family (beta/alpha)8-fold protein n=1 Tax=Propionimicrobium lymphophilum TaxID=33012 RepID=UPI0004257503|nr:hypothetical protein [Propionimicrobium lymphophilum]
MSYVDRVKIESEKMVAIREIPEIRMYELERISQALTSRKPGKLFKGQKLMVVACDHPPRGALAAGSIVNVLTPDEVIKSMAIASGLGRTTSYAWLRLPCADEMERVMDTATQPLLILGVDVPKDCDATLEKWQVVLAQPNVFGLVIGSSLQFPGSGASPRQKMKQRGYLE